DCIISGNSASGDGGGVQSENTSLTITNCSISGNSAGTYGGGINLYGSVPTLIFSDCDISGNVAGADGGGMRCTVGGSPNCSHCRFDNNTGTLGGGVMCISPATFTNCVFANNTASYGAGAYCFFASSAFTNCTITGNSVQNDGGGVYCYQASPVFNSTIISFSTGDGIHFRLSSTSVFEYCDVFGNSDGNITFRDGDPSNGPAGIGWLTTTNVNGDSCDIYYNMFLNPMFVDTAAANYHLLAGSPCIDAGDPDLPLNPDGTIADIGAFFYDQNANPPTSFDLISPQWGDTCWTLDTVLVWQEAVDSDPGDEVTYEVWLDTLSDLSTAWQVGSGLSDETFALGELSDDEAYYWIIHASDLNTSGTWANDTLMFYTFRPEPPSPFELLSPANGDTVDTVDVTLEWAASSDPDPGDSIAFYRVYLALDSAFTTELDSQTVSATELLWGDLADAQIYWWKVKAFDTQGHGIFSSQSWHFRIEISSTGGEDVLLPKEFALHPNWPNPFNPTTMIRYDVPTAGKVSLTIFNLLGQEVTRLVDGTQLPGAYTLSWDSGDLPSGVYLCRMEAAGFVQTRKMLLVR
ncbi:MAG: T9SS type A sorting domain-containing protein, partial [Calditrichaeota bacterium]|nr:T9SS type A sorting domain-containing protein [Calditrichota bacterium]